MFKGLIIALFAGVALLIGRQVHSFDTDQKEQAIVFSVQDILRKVHFAPQKMNDEFSSKLFDDYLKNLDGTKRFLTQEDVNKLEIYRNDLDNQILENRLDFFDLSGNLYLQSVNKIKSYYKDILSRPFEFTSNDSLELDPDKKSWAKNDAELKSQWEKIFKYEVLTRVSSEMETKSDSAPKKSFEEVEKNAREKVQKIYDDFFTRMDKVTRVDRFDMFVNSLTNLFDPHTEYFSPKEKEDFDIKMQGKFEGIGARLQNEKDYTKIVEIIPGGPAWKNKELKANDIILKVAQGNSDDFHDLTGMRVDDVVGLIRGKKGTTVKLEVKKPDGSTKIIKLIRDEVIIDEGKAKSLVVSSLDGKNEIGFIRLPSFYSEFKDNGENCADDIKREIEKLKNKNVKGIILDLRFNGGGSLSDVVDIAGYFIEKGPIVQVKQTNDYPYIHTDNDAGVLYDGPLVILINEMSASASEIMAAAMQDYNRGIILGSKATFGKGTVQRFFDLDNMVAGSNAIKPLGDLKVTTQKFYRINGGSTQLKGVESDIQLPDDFMYMNIGEREFPSALKWDMINPLTYSQNVYNIKKKQDIIERSQKRIKKDSAFILMENNAKLLKEYSDKTYITLNLNNFNKEAKLRKDYENKYKKLTDDAKAQVTVKNLDVDMAKIQLDSSTIARNDEWLKSMKKDNHVKEAVNIINDLIKYNK